MARLEIRLFGRFEARIAGELVPMPTRQISLLLALVSLEEGRAVSRASLAALLWPDRSEEQSRTSMRQALYRLRAVLESADPFPLEVDPRWIRLKSECVDIDAVRLVEAGNDAAALEKALARISGAPLEGFDETGSEIEARLSTERTRLRRMLLDGLERLSAKFSGERRHAEVEAIALRRMAIDPFDEAALRDFMTAVARQGRRNAALDAYQSCAARLRAELSVAPEEATTALWHDIRSSKGQVVKADVSLPPTMLPERAILTGELGEAAPAAIKDSHIRHIAVLHVILPTLVENLMVADPEEAEQTARETFDRIASTATRSGGVQLGVTGNEMTYAFGTMSPLERPALSAALVGLDLCSIGAKCGLEAGDALVGAGPSHGRVSQLARHLANAAAPGRVLLGPAAEAECRGALDLSHADTIKIPGLDAPLPKWQAEGDGPRDGWAARQARGLSRFVGREEELADLERSAERARIAGRVVVVVGEAGLGKSRLLHEFIGRQQHPSVIWVECSQFGYGTSLLALRRQIRVWLGLPLKTSASEAFAAAQAKIGDAPHAVNLLSALAVLLGLMDQVEGWMEQSAKRRQQLLVEAIRFLLVADMEGAPRILVVEDIHWADSETSGIIDLLVSTLGAAPVLMIVTCRPEFTHDWVHLPRVRQIRLEGLETRATNALVEQLAGAAPDLSVLKSRIASIAGGVPLFIEEVLRSLTESGHLGVQGGNPEPRDMVGLHIPASIRGVLSLRIDRLSEADRQVLQAASIVGPKVPITLLGPLSGLSEGKLETSLNALADAGLLVLGESFPTRIYAFNHALTLETVYRSILPSRRQALHRAILELFERHYADLIDEHIDEMADHAHLGGLWTRAADLCARAALQAEARSSHRRALLLYERALDALERQPQTDALRLAQADIHIRMRPALWMIGAYDRVIHGLMRAEQMSEQAGDFRLLAEIRAQRAYFHSTDGRFDEGLEFCRLAEVAAQGIDDALLHAEIAAPKFHLLRLRGNYREAIATAEAHVHVWTGEQRHDRGLQLATRAVYAHCHLSACWAGLGHDVVARQHAEAALAIAKETERPIDLYLAVHHGGQIALDAGRTEEALKLIEDSIEIATSADFYYFAAWAQPSLGEALLANGQVDRGLALLRAATEGDGALLHELIRNQALVALGEGLILAGELEDAEITLVAVLEAAQKMGQPQLEQLALRRLASAIAHRDMSAAEGYLRSAHAIALREGYAPELARIAARASELGVVLPDTSATTVKN